MSNHQSTNIQQCRAPKESEECEHVSSSLVNYIMQITYYVYYIIFSCFTWSVMWKVNLRFKEGYGGIMWKEGPIKFGPPSLGVYVICSVVVSVRSISV